jgi:hypothetical protein
MKLLRYIWALPNTFLGLLFIPLAIIMKGRMEIVDGVLEIRGELISWILRHCVPLRGGAGAITLGHVVLGRDREALLASRRHERAHVRQYEILGLAFIPVYIMASIWALINGRGAYRGNYLEQNAVEQERGRKHGR